MIKINLIPVKEKKKRKEFLAIFSIGVVCVVLVLGIIWFSFERIQLKHNLEKQIQQVKDQSKGFEEQINEYKELEAKEGALGDLKKVVKNISDTQRKPLLAMDQIALNLPDGIWLTGIIQGSGNDWNKFTIKGYSFAETTLQKYLDALQRPGGFLKEASLDIKSISAVIGNNQQIQQFEINARLAD